MSKSKLQSFVDQFIGFVEGDNAKVLGEKVYRQRQSALKSHVSSYEGDIEDLQSDVEKAEANLVKVRLNNGKLIEGKTQRAQYIKDLVAAREEVLDAQDALDSKKDEISFLKEEQAL